MALANFPYPLLTAVGGLVVITLIGTAGYMVFEDMSWLDALYMTVITVSTVGYQEVAPLHPAGKIFTVGLIVTSVGVVLFLLSALAELVLEGRLRDLMQRTSMQNAIDRMRNHVIVCGYGRFGRVVADELEKLDVPILIVEIDPAREPELGRRQVPYLIGSATSDEVLERAGIERARALVVGTASEADNVFITLAARERSPDLRIHARGESDPAIRRLRQAGADQVISAYQMGALRVAASILRPAVVDFIEISRPRSGESINLEEVRVEGGSDLVGRSLAALEAAIPRIRVVALKRGEDRIQLMPPDETTVVGGDHLVVIGESSSLASLAQQASAAAAGG